MLFCVFSGIKRELCTIELLKRGNTISGDRYQEQLIKLNQVLKQKRLEWGERTHKVILF